MVKALTFRIKAVLVLTQTRYPRKMLIRASARLVVSTNAGDSLLAIGRRFLRLARDVRALYRIRD